MEDSSMIGRLLRGVKRRLNNLPILQRITHKRGVDDIHKYWEKPVDGNQPADYIADNISLVKRSTFLVELIQKRVGPEAQILEIGCNSGRNLEYLYRAGFKHLAGIEINSQAVDLLKQSFPEMASCTQIHLSPIESVIKDFKESQFDLVFTMAVLEHVHSESEWIFKEMARITGKTLITIEDEKELSWRHFPRNYSHVFKSLGLKEVESIQCDLSIHGLTDRFFARIFCK